MSMMQFPDGPINSDAQDAVRNLQRAERAEAELNTIKRELAQRQKAMADISRELGEGCCGLLHEEIAPKVKAAVLRADCLQREVDHWGKWRDEQPWLAEIHSYQQQVKSLSDKVTRLRTALSKSCDDEREMSISEGPGHSTCGLAGKLTERVERAEAQLHAIQQGYGELGRYEKLRLKNAALVAKLAKESARLDHLDKKLHIDLSRSSSEEDVYYVSFPKDRSKPTGPIFSEKHVPLRSTVDKDMESP